MIRSATGRHWELPDEATDRHATLIAQRHNLPHLLACVLAMRGVEVDKVQEYLEPDLKELTPDPFRMQDMEAAVERFKYAIGHDQRIAVFGDYDVDGASAIALLVSWLRRIGVDAAYHVPHRRDRGYGPDPDVMAKLGSDNDLVFTVDCGSSPEAEMGLAAARTAGADVLVLDHHPCPVPPAGPLAVVNPNRDDDDSGLQDLCATGVVYMFLLAVRQRMGEGIWRWGERTIPLPNLDEFLDLVAMATVADVMPLRGLNRALVQRGLACLAERRHVGLAALMDQRKLSGCLNAANITWNLAPALNAPGRIGEDPHLATNLLLTTDPMQADQLAHQCNQLNRLCGSIQEEVQEKAEQHLQSTESGNLHWSADTGWHSGVVGIVASRLSHRHNRPVIVLALDGTTGAGSGRAPPGLDLGAAVQQAHEEGLLSRGGGYATAVGLAIEQENIKPAMERIGALLAETTPAECESEPQVPIVGLLAPHAVTIENYEALQRAGPYGESQAPQRPKFVLRGMEVTYIQRRKDKHERPYYRLQLADSTNNSIKANAFQVTDPSLDKALSGIREGNVIDAMGTLEVHDDGESRIAYIKLEDVALP